MIITITGRPCSGKSEVAKYLSLYHGFTPFYAGQIYREVAVERGLDVLELNRKRDISVDHYVDEKIKEIGERDKGKDVVVDSRTAWHFIPDSFKVFLDVDESAQISRFLLSSRNSERTDLTPQGAKASVDERWNLENERYMELYGFDNTDMSKYDCIINDSKLTIEETGEAVYEAYLNYINKKAISQQ